MGTQRCKHVYLEFQKGSPSEEEIYTIMITQKLSKSITDIKPQSRKYREYQLRQKRQVTSKLQETEDKEKNLKRSYWNQRERWGRGGEEMKRERRGEEKGRFFSSCKEKVMLVVKQWIQLTSITLSKLSQDSDKYCLFSPTCTP